MDDYYLIDKESNLKNIILINSKPVTGFVDRPEMKLFVSPVGGFPDRGSLPSRSLDWKELSGRGIFEVNEGVTASFNKWKTMVSQVLRDTVQPITQEFSGTPQANPEQLRERGALFHYNPGEQGLVRVPPAAIPIEIQAYLFELRREMQKGSFNDAVYGMVEGQAGYALSLLASSSANQILYPYMDAKHFVLSECDKFWLSNLKQSKKSFSVKDVLIETLTPSEIPDDISIKVESDVATPKDWLERSTIANSLKNIGIDDDTIFSEILKLGDVQAIKRRRTLDRVMNNPMSQNIELIAGYYAHADYLEFKGDIKQAALFRKAAGALEAQMTAPPPGQGKPQDMNRILAEREAGAPAPVSRVSPQVAPPETGAFSPQQLRQLIGRGKLVQQGSK